GAVVLALCALIPVAVAQSGRRNAAPLQQAARAYLEGRYDEVPALLQHLDSQDPAVAALKARALVARGKYADAESLLRPFVGRDGAGEAVLELGLLLQTLHKADADAILRRIAARASSTGDAQELGRAARALRALGRFQEANAAYRDAVRALPDDPVL